MRCLTLLLSLICYNVCNGQSVLVSTLTLIGEAFGLRYLYNTQNAALLTVVSGTLVLQSVLAVACVSAGVLWHRAVGRVCASLEQRRAVVARVNGVVKGVVAEGVWRAAVVLRGVVLLQALARRRQAVLRYRRVRDIASYEAATRDRRTVLTMVHCLAGVYLVLCMYMTVLYGTCGTG